MISAMKGTADSSEPQEQTARGVLVVGIVFDDPRLFSSLSDFEITDVALNSPFECMAAEFEFPRRQLSANVVDRLHSKGEWAPL